MKTKISIIFLLVSLFLTSAPLSFAQTSQNNWRSVKTLPAGTELIINALDGKTIKGSVIGVTDSEIELSVKGNRFLLLQDNINAIYYSIPKTGKRARLIGAGIGFSVGFAAALAVNKDAVYEDDYNYTGAAILFIAGGIAGGIIGNLFGKGKKRGLLIYKK